LYTERGDITRFVDRRGIEDSDRLLIQIFTGINRVDFIENLLLELGENFKHAAIIGTTTGGEIYKGKVYEHSTVVSFATFERAQVRAEGVETEDSFLAGKTLAEKLVSDRSKLIIAFADGLYSNGDAFVEAFNIHAADVPLAGGLAGDNFTFTNTYVFTKNKVINKGGVAAVIDTDELYLTSHYNLAWIPIGKEMEVTKSRGNRIYEIEGKPAVEIYKEYLGSTAEELLPYIAIEFPLVFERDGILFARACLGQDKDGSMVYEGAIYEGEKVRFSIWDTGVMLDSAAQNLKKFRNAPSEGIFVYTCLARKYLMGNEAEVETKYLQGVAPTCGFLTYGEFFNTKGKNRFMNYTFTAISISESPKVSSKIEDELKEEPDKELMRFRALVSLVNSITKELKEANKKLERLAERDPLTGLYNRRKMKEILESELRKSERYGTVFCVLMIDVDNFKQINDTYGHDEGDRVLVSISRCLEEILRDTDVVSRWGGEEFLVLMPETNKEGGITVAEKIRNHIQSEVCCEIGKNVSVSIGVTAYREGDSMDDILRRADQAMYEAKRKGKNTVVAY